LILQRGGAIENANLSTRGQTLAALAKMQCQVMNESLAKRLVMTHGNDMIQIIDQYQVSKVGCKVSKPHEAARMLSMIPFKLIFAALLLPCVSSADDAKPAVADTGRVTSHSRGLSGYIGYSANRPRIRSDFGAGMGFYAAVWPLIDQPIANFQIGLPSAWITPDNSDNKNQPLAPEGTLARRWPERGPTWSSVFQTVEGGLGYWAGSQFRYGPPKFSMNATPQCYDYEVGSPGWGFFHGSEALPDHRLGVAQLSNRLLIPPDALPFEGKPNGEFLGYSYMALPFTEPTTGDPPTGDQAWTCFLTSANFKGPIAYYIPETWSKIAKIFHYPFLHGRGLDARSGEMGGGAMEINTVPRFDSTDAQGVVYSKIPKLSFPVDQDGRSLLVQDVSYYSKAALYDRFKSWRDGGPVCPTMFDMKGSWKSTLQRQDTRYTQAEMKIAGVEKVFDNEVFDGGVWGLRWTSSNLSPKGVFPQYFKQVGNTRVAVAASEVPQETGLHAREFTTARAGAPYVSPSSGAWAKPGPVKTPYTTKLADGSTVTYAWYRFVDQPSFQQYQWSEEKKAKLQAFVEKVHAHWTLDRDYMAPPSRGKLVRMDPALLVTPPKGMEVGYVPIVIRQEVKTPSLKGTVTPTMLAGRYQHQPKENGWHEGELKQEGDKRSPRFRWTNQAGATWLLTVDLENARLLGEPGNPYFDQQNGKSFNLIMKPASKTQKPAIDGFHFLGGFYKRIDE
jgi:hypothetical protein